MYLQYICTYVCTHNIRTLVTECVQLLTSVHTIACSSPSNPPSGQSKLPELLSAFTASCTSQHCMLLQHWGRHQNNHTVAKWYAHTLLFIIQGSSLKSFEGHSHGNSIKVPFSTIPLLAISYSLLLDFIMSKYIANTSIIRKLLCLPSCLCTHKVRSGSSVMLAIFIPCNQWYHYICSCWLLHLHILLIH